MIRRARRNAADRSGSGRCHPRCAAKESVIARVADRVLSTAGAAAAAKSFIAIVRHIRA
jgi:hypothetical protein